MSSLHDTARKAAEKIVTRILEVTGAMVQPSTLAEADIEATAIIERHFAAYQNSQIEPREILKGETVMVNHERYHGPGIAQYDSGQRKRVIGVLLGNGNVWEYEVETVTPLPAPPSEVTNG